MTNSSYLVVLFCASAGKNGEELGVDEEQIVLFVYLLYDLPNNKVCIGFISCFRCTLLNVVILDYCNVATYRSYSNATVQSVTQII